MEILQSIKKKPPCYLLLSLEHITTANPETNPTSSSDLEEESKEDS